MNHHSITSEQSISEMRTQKSGLTESQASERLRENGKNELISAKRAGLLRRFLRQFADFSIIVLFAAAGVSFAVSYISGENSFTDTVVILAIVLINAVIGVFEESKAEHALRELKELSAPRAKVRRAGKEQLIPSHEIVTGDILILNAGDLIPADARLTESHMLRTDESALTGESLQVEKNANATLPADCAAADRINCVFSSSLVTHGRAEAVVTATGMNTEIGRIAGMLHETESEATPLQSKLDRLGKLLGIGALAICGVIFIIGLFRNTSVIDSFMTSVSLAVAAIPEGLPAIVTVVLSLGVGKLSKKNAVVRRLPSIETLGSATVICTDKTGTLTQNKMTVTHVWTPASGVVSPMSQDTTELLKNAAMCTDCTVSGKSGKVKITGEPTEAAIVSAWLAHTKSSCTAHREARLSELPFDSERKAMSVLYRKESGGYIQITKGAPDILLQKCTGAVSAASAANDAMARQGLRVLAVAVRTPSGQSDIKEADMKLIGLIGMEDPLRKEAAQAVEKCVSAGIVPIMITGDHELTARAIAKKAGILTEESAVITGKQLNIMSDDQLLKAVKTCRVFARVTPEHKVRIVKALKQNGETVAMTGDGINDAPALKAADIGCSMGKSGTQVARSASDMILTDDNFATIVNAVEIGRGLFDNIRKSVRFLLSSNIGEIMLVFAAAILGFPAPLLPVQLLWLNLVTDSLPAIALGVQRPEKNIMTRRPVPRGESIITRETGIDIAAEGFLFGALSLLAFCIGNSLYAVNTGRTMAFCTLSFIELFHAYNVKTSKSVFKSSPWDNPKLLLATITCLILQTSTVIIPQLTGIFGTVPLDTNQWLCVMVLSAIPLGVTELEKYIASKRTDVPVTPRVTKKLKSVGQSKKYNKKA